MFCLLQLGIGRRPNSASRPEGSAWRGAPEPERRRLADTIMRSAPTAQLRDGGCAGAAGPVTSIGGVESPSAASGRFTGSGSALVAPVESAP